MKLKPLAFIRIRLAIVNLTNLLARKWKRNFYVYLAVAFTLFALLDTGFLHITSDIRTAAFDLMVRYRLAPPPPDPDIIIVNIDEASLTAMSKTYGRWPWPRSVIGDFVTLLENDHPQAVIFDVLFSDADVFNPKSDAAFDASIAKTSNTFFPMLFLDSSSETLRQIKISQIPGAIPIPDEIAEEDATINMVLPHFQSALSGGRLGTQNVILDSDGVLRSYPVYFEGYGWRLPSMAARIAREFNWPEPATEHILLNWRGKPFSYRHISFVDAYADLLGNNGARAKDEFKNKIVIIGSTAANLYDASATPMAKTFPGVEILATAIDNLKHSDSLRFPEARIWYLLLTLLIIWLTAWAFYRDKGRNQIDSMFGLSQTILIVFSFASINFTNTYINLAGPVMLGIAYFSLARLYAASTAKVLEQNVVQTSLSHNENIHATLLLIRFDSKQNLISNDILGSLCAKLKKTGAIPKSVEIMRGDQKGIWGLFDTTIAISWLSEAETLSSKEIDQIIDETRTWLHRSLIKNSESVNYVVHQTTIHGGEFAAEGWQRLFAQALLQDKKSIIG